jgi:hypothetical protein
MGRPTRIHRFAAFAATVLVSGACAPDAPERAAEQSASTIGAELMAQQAPAQQGPRQQAPTVDRSMFEADMGPYLPPNILRATAGRWPFYWTRAMYSGNGYRGGGYGSWAVDFPKSDQQFLIVIKRLVRLNAYGWENPVGLWDPDLRKFPLIYMLEVGGMYLTEEEVVGLRGYLEAGGFVIVDDFWGPRQWDNFLWNMRRVFPDRTFVDIDLDHPIYSAYYDIERVEQVPAINNVIRRMMMVNFNTDLGDAWEWAESPAYPLELSTYAYQMGANMIVYAMSH